MYLSSTATELCSDVLGQSFGVTAGHKVLDIFAKSDWISEPIVTSLIQFDFYDMVFLNFLREKVLIEQIKQQHRRLIIIVASHLRRLRRYFHV